MEFILISTVVGLGYYLNKDGLETRNNKKQKFDLNTNGDNIYESSDTVKYKKVEQEIANDLYKKSKDTMNTNVMISGPPIPIINTKLVIIPLVHCLFHSDYEIHV